MYYSVFNNKKECVVYSAITSAQCFNRVWPGHQREIDQTETSWFTSVDMVNEFDMEIVVHDAFIKTVEIRPLSKNIPFTVNGNKITVHIANPIQFTVEVNGYKEALHVFVNDAKIYKQTENTLHFTKGIHEIGILRPKNNQTVIIDDGAILYGGIEICDCENVKVLGRGILDGSKLVRTDEKYDKTKENLFVIKNSKNIEVEGLILRDAPAWAFTVRNSCENIHINNVKLIGMWRYNSDGIDICTSKNVLVENCFVRSFDDCLVARGVHLTGEENSGCDGITFKDCTLWCDWGKNIEVWSGMHDSFIYNVNFENIYCIRVAGIVASIDTWYGSKSIIVKNISYNNIFVEGDKNHLQAVNQENDSSKYEEEKQKCEDYEHFILSIKAAKIGKYIGNQGCDENADSSDFYIEYSNIDIKNIRVISNGESFVSVIDGSKLLKLSNVNIESSDIGKLLPN